jgi:signal transduction histidine kinase
VGIAWLLKGASERIMVTPASDEGATSAGGFSALIWHALERVARPGEARLENEDAHCADELAEHLPTLWEAVWQAAAGAEPDVETVPVAVAMQRPLEHVRRFFLDLVRSVPTHSDLAQVARILSALDRVQIALERKCPAQVAERPAPAAFEVLTEVAHDLRSPLTSILFLADALRRGQSGGVSTMQQRQLGLIYGAALSLTAISSDLIEFTHGDTGLFDAKPWAFSLGNVFDSTLDVVRPIAEEKGLELRWTLPERDCRIGHPNALSRALLNLLTNALKFTNEGFVELCARELPEARVEFSVRDTGGGIPESVMATLLEPFRRTVKSHGLTFSSTGLGLSICRKLVMAMGGNLKVESKAGLGTRFWFQLDLPVAAGVDRDCSVQTA